MSNVNVNNKNKLAESLITKMLDVVKSKKLELMDRYPSDLLIHDRNMLEQYAVSGAEFAWVVGNSHTHLVILGLDVEENKNVLYLTRLSNSDVFYHIKISLNGEVLFKEITSEIFNDLSKTHVPYSKSGSYESFNLMRDNISVGYIEILYDAKDQDPVLNVTVTPYQGISKLDMNALQLQTVRAPIKLSGSLFTKTKIVFNDPVLRDVNCFDKGIKV